MPACIAQSQIKRRLGMKISVVIPAYNLEAFLLRCHGSVFAQALKPNEAIVVDNGRPLTRSLQD
jgi:cellulose synthase/poly-beta-1,6-N-acetylglucosamine synthase-like glycosyltransferase